MTDEAEQEPRIKVALVEKNGRWVFDLTHRGETISLRDAGSLNRWTALGITHHHNVSVGADGVTIDGRQLRYEDPHSVAQLEALLNEPPEVSHPPPAARPGGPRGQAADAAAGPADDAKSGTFRDSIHVTHDGFEFHVHFRTKFGEMKVEPLEAALEEFQRMRVFKPHVNLQKTGIRLAVTVWDGDRFNEEPGIEDLEHAEPEQIEDLIKKYLEGPEEAPAAPAAASTSAAATPAGRHGPAAKQVVRVALAKRPGELRYHLVFHRADGSTQEGPLLIKPNVARLQGEGIFRPDVSLTMTAMHDRFIIERTEQIEGQTRKHSDVYSLDKPEEVQRLELALNQCLKAAAPGAPSGRSAAPPPAAGPRQAAGAAAAPPGNRPPAPPAPPRAATPPAAGPRAAPTPAPTAPPRAPAQPPRARPPSETPAAESTPKPAAIPWLDEALKAVANLPPEQVNRDVFETLRAWSGQPTVVNARGFPSITVQCADKDGNPLAAEVVLISHSLLCNLPFGYLRFGPESRVFLEKLDDFLTVPEYGLRGVVASSQGRIRFLVSEGFARAVNAPSAREYRQHFGNCLGSPNEVPPDHEWVWPLSREERVFRALLATARRYGLPVTPEGIRLDPHREGFLGFRRTAHHGMEFSNGEDFVRFLPTGVEISEAGVLQRQPATGILLGWAIDAQGRVCALHEDTEAFTPPAGSKLLRFISRKALAAEGGQLTMLASAEAPAPA
jgi:hypothetical protein